MEEYLESHERRHLVIPSQSNQNTLLFHEIRMERAILNSLRMACHRSSTDHVNNTQNRPIFREIRFGCAIFNTFRISHAPSTQCTSCTSTHHADSNTKHNAPPQNPIRVHYPENALKSLARRPHSKDIALPSNRICMRSIKTLESLTR